jgi:transcriptional regulator, CdaR family
VKNANSNSAMVSQLVKYQLEMLLTAYRERFDKDNFIKSPSHGQPVAG